MLGHINSRNHLARMRRIPIEEMYEAWMTEETAAERVRYRQDQGNREENIMLRAQNERQLLAQNNERVANESIRGMNRDGERPRPDERGDDGRGGAMRDEGRGGDDDHIY